MKTWPYALIVAAAALWGIISVFVKGLASFGFSSLQIVALRVTVSAVILALYIGLTKPNLLRLRLADSKYFIGTGVFSLAFFNWCYFTAIQETSVAIAAILLYTSPVFVLVLSRLLFAENLTGGKLAALVVVFCGCALVVGILPDMSGTASPFGIVAGLGAGFGYALYSIFGRFALQHYTAMTVTVYTFIFAAAVMLPASGLWKVSELLFNGTVLALIAGFSLFSTILAYICYTVALKYVETGRAAIVATLEPIIAAAVGAVLFGQALSHWQLLGIVLVVAAVAAVQRG